MKRFVFLCCCVLLLAVAKGGTQPLDSTKSAIASTEGRSARTGTPYDLEIVWGPRGGFTSGNNGLTAFGSPRIETRREEGAPAEQVPERWRLLMQKLQQPAPSSPEDVSASSMTALLRGDYVFSSSGASYDFILGADVQSAIGGFTFDGRGSFTGFQTSRTLFKSRTFFRIRRHVYGGFERRWGICSISTRLPRHTRSSSSRAETLSSSSMWTARTFGKPVMRVGSISAF
jgi:hypothetical protein